MSVSVASLLGARGADAGLEFDLLAGAAGLERAITLPYVQKTGLALAGFDEYLRPGRVLVFGESEVRYLERMPASDQHDALTRLFGRDFPCVVLTLGLDPPADMLAEAERAGVPVLRTKATTPTAIARLTTLLEDRMAARELLHGVLLDVLGLGVLITGESGIGKSECALDLVGRGHRLVADDTVEVRMRGADRQLPGIDAPLRGDPRTGPGQCDRPLRRGRDSFVQTDRTGGAIGAVGDGP
jgi:HPr kinase/phosphorylase